MLNTLKVHLLFESKFINAFIYMYAGRVKKKNTPTAMYRGGLVS